MIILNLGLLLSAVVLVGIAYLILGCAEDATGAVECAGEGAFDEERDACVALLVFDGYGANPMVRFGAGDHLIITNDGWYVIELHWATPGMGGPVLLDPGQSVEYGGLPRGRHTWVEAVSAWTGVVEVSARE